MFVYHFTTSVMSQLSQKPLGEEKTHEWFYFISKTCPHMLEPLDDNVQLRLVYNSTYY